jgi:hypothetical protein
MSEPFVAQGELKLRPPNGTEWTGLRGCSLRLGRYAGLIACVRQPFVPQDKQGCRWAICGSVVFGVKAGALGIAQGEQGSRTP